MFPTPVGTVLSVRENQRYLRSKPFRAPFGLNRSESVSAKKNYKFPICIVYVPYMLSAAKFGSFRISLVSHKNSNRQVALSVPDSYRDFVFSVVRKSVNIRVPDTRRVSVVCARIFIFSQNFNSFEKFLNISLAI